MGQVAARAGRTRRAQLARARPPKPSRRASQPRQAGARARALAGGRERTKRAPTRRVRLARPVHLELLSSKLAFPRRGVRSTRVVGARWARICDVARWMAQKCSATRWSAAESAADVLATASVAPSSGTTRATGRSNEPLARTLAAYTRKARR